MIKSSRRSAADAASPSRSLAGDRGSGAGANLDDAGVVEQPVVRLASRRRDR
jgi:hypothetical protein